MGMRMAVQAKLLLPCWVEKRLSCHEKTPLLQRTEVQLPAFTSGDPQPPVTPASDGSDSMLGSDITFYHV